MLNDNWLEVMKHLSIDLPSLYLSSKRLYTLFLNHKKILCDEGNYRFSAFQHQLLQDMTKHITMTSVGKHPLLIQPNDNVGKRAAILATSVRYLGTTVILTHKTQNAKWHREIKKMSIENILICGKHYCDAKMLKFASVKQFDPNLLGYKIIIINAKHYLDVIKNHSLVIIYKMPLLINTVLPPNTILFGGKVKTAYQKYTYLEYENPPTMLQHHHLCCYRDDAEELYLEPLTDDYQYKTLTERLDTIIYNIIMQYDGPYLIVGHDITTTHKMIPYKPHTTIRKHDIIFNKSIVHGFKTLILLWPGHGKGLNLNHLYNMNVFHVHSTIEEQFIERAKHQADRPRKKIEFLKTIRTLILKYGYDKVTLLPDTYFGSLMYMRGQDLNLVLEKINHLLS